MRTVRQTGIHGPRLIGRIEHFKEALVDHQWQRLSAILFLGTESGPTRFNVLLVSVFEACRRCNFVGVAVQLATFFVARHVKRKHHFSGKFAALFQHGIDGVRVGFGMLGHGLQFIF